MPQKLVTFAFVISTLTAAFSDAIRKGGNDYAGGFTDEIVSNDSSVHMPLTRIPAALFESEVPSFDDMENGPELGAEAERKINMALQVVGKSDSQELRTIVKEFEPTYMLVGGTSQAKDSLMMMFMGLPFAFQGQGIATRMPVVYRVLKSSDDDAMEVTMHFEDKESADRDNMPPEEVVSSIEKHMGKYANPSRFGGKPIEVMVTGPDLKSAVYKNMMGRMNGKDKASLKNEKMIDAIYEKHASEPNVMLVAVEQKDHSPKNSMIAPFVSQVDPEGERTLWVKTWADYGINEKSASSGKSCEEVQQYFEIQDFEKPPGSFPTFWIATIEAESYLTDPSLSFKQRRDKLEEAIKKKEAKMQKFFDDWREKGCTFKFEQYTKVTQLRAYLSKIHGRMVMESLQKLIKALYNARSQMKAEIETMETRLKAMPMGSSPSLELMQLTIQYKGLWDAQWSDDRSVGKSLALTDTEIMKIQDNELHMTASKLAFELVKSWRAGRSLDAQEEVITQRLELVAGMLVYPPSQNYVSVTGHLWNHLTNMFILLAISLSDLIKQGKQLWRQSAISIVGPNPCHSAVMEAQTMVGSGWAQKIGNLMEFSILWLMKKHQNIVHQLLLKVPMNKAYADDAMLNGALQRMGDSFLTEWSNSFHADFRDQLKKVSINVQQHKIQTMLNAKMAQYKAPDAIEMRGSRTAYTYQLNYEIRKCRHVDGAVVRETSKEQFPNCKCKRHTESVYCGIDQVAERKFNAELIRGHPSCRFNSKPYCSVEPVTPDTYVIRACTDVDGARERRRENAKPFPSCKCLNKKDSVYCGTEKVADLKFDADLVQNHASCRLDSKPYCSNAPVTPDTGTTLVTTIVAKENSIDDLRRVAEALNPSATDCNKLYDDLVNSGLNELALYLGSEMYYMAYTSPTPITSNVLFSEQLARRLIGEKDDKSIAKTFKSLGNRARLVELLKTTNANLQSIIHVQTYFEQALG